LGVNLLLGSDLHGEARLISCQGAAPGEIGAGRDHQAEQCHDAPVAPHDGSQIPQVHLAVHGAVCQGRATVSGFHIRLPIAPRWAWLAAYEKSPYETFGTRARTDAVPMRISRSAVPLAL